MASVFGIDLLRSTTELLRSATRRSRLLRRATAEQIAELAFQGLDKDVTRLVQNEIIPRLVKTHGDRPAGGSAMAMALHDRAMAHGAAASPMQHSAGDDAAPSFAITASDVDATVVQALSGDVAGLKEIADDLMARGCPAQTLFIELIAPAARRLGVLWEEDVCDFIDVTMGLWRLQELLREIAEKVPPPAGWTDNRRSALFSTMPGDQHSLGTLMVGECFQQAGWDTVALIQPSQQELIDTVARRPFDLVGLTVSQDFHIGTLPKLLSGLRSVSHNPKIAIMIGGPALAHDLARAQALGADGAASDAASAVSLADQLVQAGGQRQALPL